MSTRQDFAANAGEDLVLTFTMNPLPSGGIAGWTLLCTVKSSLTGAVLTTSAGTVTDGPNGKFQVTLTRTQTGTTLGVGTWFYDVWRTDSGLQAQLAYGNLTLNQPVRAPS